MLECCWIVILLVFIPIILGLPWTKEIKCNCPWAFAYGTGFFVELALFEIVSVPFVLFHGMFSSVVVAYSCALVIICCLCVWVIIKKRIIPPIKRIKKVMPTELVYFVALICIISIQIIRSFTYDISYMSYDDYGYIGWGTDAVQSNALLNISELTGTAEPIDIKRALQTSLIFVSYLSEVSKVSVVTMAHTVQRVQYTLLCYIISWYVAGELFQKRENRFIFVLIIALFYWFGYHSHYSLTFRLLGPNYQGKAVVAVSLTPLLLLILSSKLKEKINCKIGFLLLLLSISATALSLWGAGTIIFIAGIPIILSMFQKERKWRNLLYIPWACTFPIFSILLNYLYNFAV